MGKTITEQLDKSRNMSNKANASETIYYKVPVYVGDLILHFATFYVLISFSNLTEDIVFLSKPIYLAPYFLLFLSYSIAISTIGIKLNERIISDFTVAKRAVLQSFWTILIFMFSSSIVYHTVPWLLLLVQFAISSILVAIYHLAVRYIIKQVRKSGKNTRSVVMIGADENLVSIYNEMTEGYGIHGYKIIGFFTDKYQLQIPERARNLGRVDDAPAFLEKNKVDEVYCSINPAANEELVNSIILKCENNFMNFWFVPNMNGYPHRRMRHTEFGPVTVISLREEPLNNPLMKFWKRTVDIIFSGLFLITLYPFVWLFAAIGIKLSSPGPILFRQKRTGYSGKAFDCLKFRSMKVNADADKVQATEHDPRKTKFGDFLRKTSIDELPQFINVFKGDMSIVGPRPHMEYHTEIYSKLISDYMVRHLLKPGITGWAQVNGCRGETKTLQEMKDRVEHDIWYIEHWSPWLDIKIIFMTIAQVFKGDKQAY